MFSEFQRKINFIRHSEKNSETWLLKLRLGFSFFSNYYAFGRLTEIRPLFIVLFLGVGWFAPLFHFFLEVHQVPYQFHREFHRDLTLSLVCSRVERLSWITWITDRTSMPRWFRFGEKGFSNGFQLVVGNRSQMISTGSSPKRRQHFTIHAPIS